MLLHWVHSKVLFRIQLFHHYIHNAKVVEVEGFEPTQHKWQRVYSPSRLSNSGARPYLNRLSDSSLVFPGCHKIMIRIWKYKKRFQLFYLSISTVCTVMIIVSDYKKIKWRKGWDSNPRTAFRPSPVFKTGAFNQTLPPFHTIGVPSGIRTPDLRLKRALLFRWVNET